MVLSFLCVITLGVNMQTGQASLGEANTTGILEEVNKTTLPSEAVTNEWWSSFRGGAGGDPGDRKVCPRDSFIKEFIVQDGNSAHGFSGISKIGQVTCSDGTKLACCDGVGRHGDRIVTLQAKNGATRAKIVSDDIVRGVCLGWECAGKRGRGHYVRCPSGSVIAGFQTFRGVLVDSIRFMCRASGDGHDDFKCGRRILAIRPRFCPRSYRLLPCGKATLNTLCSGDGNCGTQMDLHNCGHRSIYLKL